jgi:hypothetical protein
MWHEFAAQCADTLGMENRTRIALPRITLALLTLLATPGFADQASTNMRVSARVAPLVQLRTDAPAELAVTAEDLARGYVELPAPLRVTIRSNFAGGVALDVRAMRRMFSSIHLRGDDLHASLPGEGGAIALRNATNEHASITQQWRVRFDLNPELPPGNYRWPLSLEAQPLTQ